MRTSGPADRQIRMTLDITLASAFLVGLLGSTHCLGMCGGIVSALTFGLRADLRRSPWTLGPYLLAYNSGRIGSYVGAGAIAGAVGAGALGVLPADATRWPVKLVLPIGFALLALQGVAELVRRAAMLTGALPLSTQYDRPAT